MSTPPHDFTLVLLGERCRVCWQWKSDVEHVPCPGRKVVPLGYAPTPCPSCGERLCKGVRT